MKELKRYRTMNLHTYTCTYCFSVFTSEVVVVTLAVSARSAPTAIAPLFYRFVVVLGFLFVLFEFLHKVCNTIITEQKY